MQGKIAAVIVTYNRKELLAKCLQAVYRQTRPADQIVVIDNHSTDGTEAYIRQQAYPAQPELIYRRLSANSGGAGGFHEGIRLARQNGADWVWIMDDDVIPDPTCLAELLAAREKIKGRISFLASSVRGTSGEAMNVPKLTRKQFLHYTDWYQYLDEGIVQVVKATFVSLLLNGAAIDRCGLPWKPFFIWGDDSEYTQRLIRDFGPAYKVGKSKATHLRGSAQELSIVKETNPDRIPLYFYYYRNNLIGFWEYETPLYCFLCMGKLWWDALQVLCKGKYKGRKLRVIGKAFVHFVFGLYDRTSFRNRSKTEKTGGDRI